jgi:hypothetical protein
MITSKGWIWMIYPKKPLSQPTKVGRIVPPLKFLPQIYPISVNISLPPYAIRSYPTSPSSLHLIEDALGFSPFGLVFLFRATADDALSQSCADICCPWQVCTSPKWKQVRDSVTALLSLDSTRQWLACPRCAMTNFKMFADSFAVFASCCVKSKGICWYRFHSDDARIEDRYCWRC